MATAPQSPMGGDPSDDDAQDSSESASGGFTIELKVDAQGKMSLSVESNADEDGEEGSDSSGGDSSDSGDDSDDAQPVSSLREAFKLITEIIAHAGQMQDSGADESQMSSGYGS